MGTDPVGTDSQRFTSLTEGGSAAERNEVGVSSLMDTWLLLRNVETGAERNRLLLILKSRGMAHSNQVREFLLTDGGIQLGDVYLGSGTVLPGSARLVQEARDKQQTSAEQQMNSYRRRELEQEQTLRRAQLDAGRLKTSALAEELRMFSNDEQVRWSVSLMYHSQVSSRSFLRETLTVMLAKSTSRHVGPAESPTMLSFAACCSWFPKVLSVMSSPAWSGQAQCGTLSE